MKQLVLISVFVALSFVVGQEYSPADTFWRELDYYSGTENLSGKELKTRLHQIISGHKSYSYGQLWELISYTDEDPNNSNQVILFYTGWSVSNKNHGGSDSQWNREHTWAKSRGNFGTTAPAGTDLHHLRPTDVSVNRKRGHLDFDEGGVIYHDGDGLTECRVDDDSWEPRQAVKGDVARILFYMATRYEGGGEPELELIDKIVADAKDGIHGKLSVLLKWHQEDPVDYFERRRNDRIYELQHNRNPFIDHPEFALKIWKNDITLELESLTGNTFESGSDRELEHH